MPRGHTDGSVYRTKEKFDTETGRVIRHARITVRRRYTDLLGKVREKKRIASTEAEAGRLLRKIDREIEKELAGGIEALRPRTVTEVIKYCKEHHFKPAIYAGDTKVSGQRTWRATWNALKPFEKQFGTWLISELSYDDLQDYTEERFRTPVVIRRVRYEGKGATRKRIEYSETRPRTIAAVNRELAWVRRVFTIAKTKNWVRENPFLQGASLINISLENKKLRILSFDEERRLFSKFSKETRRTHLAFAVLMALETAMRKSEQFRLDRDKDIDLERRLLTALSYKGRRTSRRYIPITELLLPHLEKQLDQQSGTQLFDIDNPKKAFAHACRDAGIEGVTWHNLRHTAITRMVHVYKIPPHDVMKISGHTNWNTFWNTYVNLDEEMVRSIGARIDAARAEAIAIKTSEPGIAAASEAVN